MSERYKVTLIYTDEKDAVWMAAIMQTVRDSEAWREVGPTLPDYVRRASAVKLSKPSKKKGAK